MTDDDLLTPKPIVPNPALRAELLARTGRRVGRAAWRQRATWAAAGLACFGLGWATTYLRPTPEPVTLFVEVPIPPIPPAPPPDSPAPAVQAKARTPAELELEAE